MHRRPYRLATCLAGLVPSLIILSDASVAIAQTDYAAEASEIHAPGAGEKNAAEAVLTALAALDAPPESIPDTPSALLIQPGDPGWSDATEWATAPNQRAALRMLRAVTDPADPHTFSLPYGRENTPPTIFETGLAVDLGDTGLLAAADFVYLDALDELFALASVDAARLADENDGEAAYRMVQWIRLARMVADQPLSTEKRWGIHSMRLGAMRLLDLFALHPQLMSDREIVRLLRELTEDEIRVERILPPYADRVAMHELIDATYIERRGPNPATFAPILSHLISEGQALSLFGEVSYFQRIAEQQANWFDVTEQVDAIYNDWERRWIMPHYDRIWTQQMERRLIDPARFTLIEHFSPDLYGIFQDRLALRADLAGARLALGVIGYRRSNGVWPSDLAALRPTFVQKIDADPFHDGGDRFVKQFKLIEYFVPIRDQTFGEREEPYPHAIRAYRAGDLFAGFSHSNAQVAADVQINDAIDQIIAGIDRASRDALARAFIRVAEAINELGVNGSNYKAKVNESMSEIATALTIRASGANPAELTTIIGMDPETVQEHASVLLTDQLRMMFENDAFTTAYAEARRSRGRLDQDVARRGLEAIFESEAKAMLNLQRRLRPSSFGPDYFDVELDEQNFVIYARGIDRRADWAREVGPGAADYLIWPPVMTLLRAELRQEPPMQAWTD